MGELKVEVCGCTECVMKGAMELADSIESMKKVKGWLGYDGTICVTMDRTLGEPRHGDDSPLVAIEGEIVRHADSETVMEKIVEKMKELQ